MISLDLKKNLQNPHQELLKSKKIHLNLPLRKIDNHLSKDHLKSISHQRIGQSQSSKIINYFQNTLHSNILFFLQVTFFVDF